MQPGEQEHHAIPQSRPEVRYSMAGSRLRRASRELAELAVAAVLELPGVEERRTRRGCTRRGSLPTVRPPSWSPPR